jgi:hypothetical protein
MPFDGVNFDIEALEDLRVLRATLKSLSKRGALCTNFSKTMPDGSESYCVIGWLNHHSGERPSNVIGQKIAAQRLYKVLPFARIRYSVRGFYSHEAGAVMAFNDLGFRLTRTWRVKRLLKRGIRQLEMAITGG